MKTASLRYLVAPGALFAAALVFAGVVVTPATERPALQVWRAGALPTEVVSGLQPDGSTTGLSYLKASNAEAADAFGSAVALSRDGRTLVVGADLEAGGGDGAQDRNDQPGSGAVYVFVRSAAGWVQQAYLKAAQPEAGAGFGLAVAVSDDGDTIVVGAPFEAHAQGEGAVHVFHRAFGTWHAQSPLLPAAGGQAGLFGTRVAIAGQGGVIAVAAREGTAALAHGAVHLFGQRDGRWVPAARLESVVPVAGDGFGQSLALAADGRTLAVGSRPDAAAAIPPAGAAGSVHVFAHDAAGWTRAAALPDTGAGPAERVATEVALSADGQRLAVGTLGAAGRASAVRVFDRQPQGWAQSATVPGVSAGWGFGERLSLSADGRRLAVSAMYEPLQAVSGTERAEAGAVYLFTDTGGGQWSQTERLSTARGRAGDLFGSAVSLSGDGRWVATGARLEDGGARGVDAGLPATPAANSGAVYVYAPA